MQNKDLPYHLTSRTEDLRKELNTSSTVHCELSWLFVPEQPHGKICLVAHIDTVHSEDWATKRLVYENGVIRSPQGLGADDRAGVWAALELYRISPLEYQPYVLLTDKEEVGCIGAREAAMLFGSLFFSPAITYFIELDREGSRDAVFYCNEPVEFRYYVKSFGFTDTQGTSSDIRVLGPVAGKCAVNLSTGYYDAHTKTETLCVSELHVTMEKVREMIRDNDVQQRVWRNVSGGIISRRTAANQSLAER